MQNILFIIINSLIDLVLILKAGVIEVLNFTLSKERGAVTGRTELIQ